MGKKLAIKGHSTRGKEVIELLEMMGGKAIAAKGDDETAIYVIPVNGIIDARFAYQKHIDNYAIFTLEEFYKKYPFKIGDKVIDLKTNKIAEVYKMHWSENTNCVYYDIKYPNNCGCTRRFMDLKSMDDNKDVHSISECKTIGQGTYAIKIADGYKFDSIDENGNIIVKAFKPKLTYPTMYKECCDVLKIPNDERYIDIDVPLDYNKLLSVFTELLICRKAYYKIYGEQMGLGKPWEPDWTNLDQLKYCIWVDVGEFITMINVRGQHILAFPTEEMRDTFYENFKDLIEQCKELL